MPFYDLYVRFLIWLGAEPPQGYTEPLSSAQKIKYSFLTAAFVTTIILFILFVALFIFSCCDPILTDDPGRTSVFNLVIDVAVGFFTVWGLYWAASEFAEAQIKPDLHFIVGASGTPLRNPSDAFQGHCIIGNGNHIQIVRVGLFLENKQPKAAQFVRITLRPKNVPIPSSFTTNESLFPDYKPRFNHVFENQQHAIFLQFDDTLVVYKGDGVYLGDVLITWPMSPQPPKNLSLDVGLYNLVGEPKSVVISRPIHWIH